MVQIEKATPEDLHAAKEASVCFGCPKFKSKGITVGDVSDEEIEFVVDEIEDIVRWEDAGFPTDWDAYDYETMQLVVMWRTTEAVVKENRGRRFDALVKSFLK
jgi:hypothetical protein